MFKKSEMRNRVPRVVRTIMSRLRKRVKGHDFSAEIPDDRWVEQVREEFLNYLTPRELGRLREIDGETDTEFIPAACDIVEKAFMRHLGYVPIRKRGKK